MITAKEAVTIIRSRLKHWEDTPDSDAETILAAIDMGIREVARRFRCCVTCARSFQVDPPTGTSDVISKCVYTVDLAATFEEEAPNKGFLGIHAVYWGDNQTPLMPVPWGEIPKSVEALWEEAQKNSEPRKYAVVPRSYYAFNLHLWPPPYGIDEDELVIWFYYVPGPLTSEDQKIELPAQYVDFIWPFTMYQITGAQKYLLEFENTIKRNWPLMQTEAPIRIHPLNGYGEGG